MQDSSDGQVLCALSVNVQSKAKGVVIVKLVYAKQQQLLPPCHRGRPTNSDSQNRRGLLRQPTLMGRLHWVRTSDGLQETKVTGF